MVYARASVKQQLLKQSYIPSVWISTWSLNGRCSADSESPCTDNALTPCLFLYHLSHPVPALNVLGSGSSGLTRGYSCNDLLISSGPLIGVPLHLCWINQRYTALSSSWKSDLLTTFLFLMQSPSWMSVRNVWSLALFLTMSWTVDFPTSKSFANSCHQLLALPFMNKYKSVPCYSRLKNWCLALHLKVKVF